MKGLTKKTDEDALSFPRQKSSGLTAPLAYRFSKLVGMILGPEKRLKFLLELHRLFGRLAFEQSGVFYADNFHLETKGFSEEFLAGYLNSEMTIVDIGCGTGRWSRVSAKYARSVIGIDFDPSLIDAASTLTSEANVEFIVGDVTTDIPDVKYDVGILSHVIEHIVEIDEFLSKIHRVAEKILVEVPDFGADPLNMVRLELGSDFYSDADHVREYTRETLTSQLERNGWIVEEMFQRHGCICCVAIGQSIS